MSESAGEFRRMYEACPGSAPGPFYVVAGGCAGCPSEEDVGLRAALMDVAIIPGEHCRFVTQPLGARELQTSCAAVRQCTAGAVRYAGTDKTILDRIARTDPCDALPLGGAH